MLQQKIEGKNKYNHERHEKKRPKEIGDAKRRFREAKIMTRKSVRLQY